MAKKSSSKMISVFLICALALVGNGNAASISTGKDAVDPGPGPHAGADGLSLTDVLPADIVGPPAEINEVDVDSAPTPVHPEFEKRTEPESDAARLIAIIDAIQKAEDEKAKGASASLPSEPVKNTEENSDKGNNDVKPGKLEESEASPMIKDSMKTDDIDLTSKDEEDAKESKPMTEVHLMDDNEPKTAYSLLKFFAGNLDEMLERTKKRFERVSTAPESATVVLVVVPIIGFTSPPAPMAPPLPYAYHHRGFMNGFGDSSYPYTFPAFHGHAAPPPPPMTAESEVKPEKPVEAKIELEADAPPPKKEERPNSIVRRRPPTLSADKKTGPGESGYFLH